MGLTVGEVKENADYNLNTESTISGIMRLIGKEQLKNYNIAKELGADDEDDWLDWETKVEEYANNS